jgi:hypothetical protein
MMAGVEPQLGWRQVAVVVVLVQSVHQPQREVLAEMAATVLQAQLLVLLLQELVVVLDGEKTEVALPVQVVAVLLGVMERLIPVAAGVQVVDRAGAQAALVLSSSNTPTRIPSATPAAV